MPEIGVSDVRVADLLLRGGQSSARICECRIGSNRRATSLFNIPLGDRTSCEKLLRALELAIGDIGGAGRGRYTGARGEVDSPEVRRLRCEQVSVRLSQPDPDRRRSEERFHQPARGHGFALRNELPETVGPL